MPNARIAPISWRRCVTDMAKALKIRKPAANEITIPTPTKIKSKPSIKPEKTLSPSPQELRIPVLTTLVATIIATPKDTAKALKEAQTKGVEVFCVTVDKSGNDYLKRMCPPSRYLIIDEIEDLPEKLSKVYQVLTGK